MLQLLVDGPGTGLRYCEMHCSFRLARHVYVSLASLDHIQTRQASLSAIPVKLNVNNAFKNIGDVKKF